MSQSQPITKAYATLGRVVVGLAIVLGILPFAALCWYAHPSADDFLTANQVQEHGHWGYISYMYMQWTGRYTSAALWGLLSPVAYGNITEGYGAVCLLHVLGLPVACYVLLKTLLGAQFSKGTVWLASGVLALLFLFQMPSPAEAFYWITSNYNYILPAYLTLGWLAALLCLGAAKTTSGRRKWFIVTAVLAVVVVGGNETNALPMLFGTAGITLLQSLRQRRIAWVYVALSTLLVVACAVAFLAPGNYVRLAQSARQFTMLQAADKAALATYRTLIGWVGNGVLLAITVLLLPVSFRLSRVPGLPLNRLAQRPEFMLLLMPAILFFLLFVAFWTTSTSMPARSRNVLYLFFLVWWFVHAHAWACYVWRRYDVQAMPLPRTAYWLLVVWVVGVFALGHTRRMRGREPRDNANNIVKAYQDWLGGAAARYDAQLTARYAYLRGQTPADVVVERLQAPPTTILFSDLETDTNDWANQAYADFFGKNSIRVSAEAPATTQP
ncbi:DUF6056 family protein [Solirubrum puertoriconensis]|uniref:Uncharacterized protein n=1 Tax=Solirubrum puertoriconensis TaxID=1751427 RepID=A0A9X0L310_SOLP1|nr:DUF6056 family protein [Solirubrum puertoriconensis]KUG06005.1 hypothetical protein ASU33_01120 [Solirubrum puertoriconensis]